MIIAIKPPENMAEKLAVEGGLKPSTLHFTLFFLGKSEEVSQEKYTEYVQAIQDICADTKPFSITMSEKGKFENVRMTTDPDGNFVPAENPTDVILLKAEGEELFDFRSKLADLLDERDLYFSRLHKTFSPHLSLKYVPHGEELELDYETPIEFLCSSIELWGDGDEFKQTIDLKGE